MKGISHINKKIDHPWIIYLFYVLVILIIFPKVSNSTVMPPVRVVISSEETLSIGQEMTIIVLLESYKDLPDVRFEIITTQTQDWQLTGGQSIWTGLLSMGKPVTFNFTAIPLNQNPEPISGILKIPQWPDTEWKMDMSKIGIKSETRPIKPLIKPEMIEIKSIATVTARGRFVYTETLDNGQTRTVGIRNARVRLWDYDWFWPCGPSLNDCRELMAEGWTDPNGYFNITGSGGDFLGDLPDPYVEIEATSEVGSVKVAGLMNPPIYCFKSSGYINNAQQGAILEYNEIAPHTTGGCSLEDDVTDEHGAWHVYNNLREAYDFMTPIAFIAANETILPVDAFWPLPGVGSYYNGSLNFAGVHTWHEWTLGHEYGHHLLGTLAESPPPDYSLGGPGHLIWAPEYGNVAWTEGWPNYFGTVHVVAWAHDSPGFFESHADDPAFSGQEDHIEGFVAAILWDLYDDVNDDMHNDGPGARDAIVLNFFNNWYAIANYHPRGAGTYPVDVYELWDSLKIYFPDFNNGIGEVYGEHHIIMNGKDVYVDKANTCMIPNGEIGCYLNFYGGPFRAVSDAVTFGTYFRDRLFIKTGSYNEQLTINKAMELHAWDGAVSIGQ